VSDMDRRRYARFQVPVKILVRGGGVEQTCFTAEIGMGGCSLTLSRSVAEGALLQVELSSTRLPDRLTGSAQVVWVAQKAPWRAGLKFSATLVEVMGPFLRALVPDARLMTDGSS
jgi:hypothetical protein